ncbi:cytochrome b5 domain-containing protein, partial [bacterium]
VSEFLDHHPGGARLLRGYSGMDATDAYARAHDNRSEIDAMREMYVVGRVRRLELEGVSAVVHGAEGPHTIALAGAHRAWCRGLGLIVEMQNALANDHALQDASTTRGEPRTPRSIYRLQKAVETHERFLRSYLDGLSTDTLPNLWRITQAFFAMDRDPEWMKTTLDKVRASYDARCTESAVPVLFEAVQHEIASSSAGTHVETEHERLLVACEALERHDRRLLANVKEGALAAVALFEEFERDVTTRGRDRMVAACEMLASCVQAFYEGMAARLSELGWAFDVAATTSTSLSLAELRAMTSLLRSEHYTLTETTTSRVVTPSLGQSLTWSRPRSSWPRPRSGSRRCAGPRRGR